MKGAIKKIFSTLQRMPKTAIEQWRKYLQGLKDKSFFDNLRSAKLLNCLSESQPEEFEMQLKESLEEEARSKERCKA